jgi:hypothetical protein
MADGSGENSLQPIGGDGRGKSAVYGSGGFIACVSDGTACFKTDSGSSTEYMGMRISRYQLCVVDSMAAHSRDGSVWVACALEIADQGKVLSHPPGAGRLWRFPARSDAARRYLRAFAGSSS